MLIREAERRFGWPRGRMKVCELTLNYSCNARCVFCYSSPDMEEWRRHPDLRLKQAADRLLLSYKNGSRMVQFIGGEPTVYEELPRLIRLAAKIGYPAVQVISNGIRLADRAYARELVESGLNTASISLQGRTAAAHDAVTGVKGSFAKACRACENLSGLGVYLNVNSAVTALNYRDLPGFVEFVLGRFPTDSIHLIATHCMGAAEHQIGRLVARYSEQVPYVREAVGVFAAGGVRPAFRFLSNYLPCLMPEHANLMKDWELPEEDDDLFLPEETHVGRMYKMVTERLRTKSAKCGRCAYFKVCAGFERAYAQRYGEEEFRPVRRKRSSFALKPYYA